MHPGPMLRSFAAVLVVAALTLSAQASPQERTKDWSWRIAPYLWATDIEGSLAGAVGQAEFEADFDDIWDNLGSAGLVLVEARKGRLSFVSDLVYMSLDSQGEGPGGAPAEAEMDTFIGHLAGMVRLSPDSTFELGAGLRYASFHTGLVVGPVTSDADHDVFDGFVAGRAHWPFAKTWYLAVYGDVGAGESDLTWQASATLGWQAPGWGMAAGYRALGYDIESGNRELDLAIHGVLLGVEFRL